MLTSLHRLIVKHPFPVVFLYIGTICFLFLFGTYNFDTLSREQQVVGLAKSHARTFAALHQYYSSEIVPRATAAGAEMSQYFRDTDNRIPYPATLTNDFGRVLNQDTPGLTVRLYSAYPFPWNADRILDAFEQDALAFLEANPESEFIRTVPTERGDIVRYAIAQTMSESCIACHNRSDFQSDRLWKIGDFRGVREVTVPLRGLIESNYNGYILGTALALGAAIVGMLIIWPLVRTLRTSLSNAERLSARLADLANQDPLTGLASLRLCLDRLNQAMQEADRYSKKVAILFIDLDGFKKINDVHGHEAGNDVLRAFADRLSITVRGIDTVARVGGDEFVIILNGIDDAQFAQKVALRVISAGAEPFKVPGGIDYISTSIGISIYPEHGLARQDLIEKADSAMYAVKATGKNNFHLYNDDIPAAGRRLSVSALES
ncbi:MAG: diguanylate cyclase [Thalassospira sp.]|uniref:diguanylate cyclase domain-containing protein n=1 Tax=Thalassospira sp. TaxID=1912094 RepID=UPI0032ED68FE